MLHRTVAVALTALGTAAACLAAPTTAHAAPADPISACKLPNRGFLSEGLPSDWNTFQRPIGKIRAAVIFHGWSNPAAEMAKFKPATENHFRTSSYGRYELELVRVPTQVQLSKEAQRSLAKHSAENDPDRQGDVVRNSALASAWQEAVRRADPGYDFSQDDVVIYVDASVGRSYAEPGSIVADGKTLKGGATIGSDWAQQDSWRAKLLGHELGHTISLPDEYGGAGGYEYTGGWGLMSAINGPSPDYFAWEKWKLGWLDDPQMSCVRTLNSGTEQTLTPVESSSGTKAVVVRFSDTQAYVAEVRTKRGVNTASCDTGVLIYWIDSARASGSGPVQVRDARPGSGGCGGNEVNDGAWDVGQTFTDTASQVRIQVVSQSGDDFVVRATYGTPPPTGVTVFSDDFETDKGWQANLDGADTATTGIWERGDPEATTYNGQTYQRGDTTSGANDLVTGRLAGTDGGSYDVDGGLTSIRSPEIALPSTGTITLSLQQYLAHADNASAADFLRIKVVGTTTATVFEQLGSAVARPGGWAAVSADLSRFAGQRVRVVVEAADNATGSMVEAGIDDVKITKS